MRHRVENKLGSLLEKVVCKGYRTTMLLPALDLSQVVDYIMALVALLRRLIGRTNTIKTGHNKRIIQTVDLGEGHLTWNVRSATQTRHEYA